MPGQLKEVRTRIGAVKSTQQITKAMKLVAASKLRKAQERIVRMRPYANKLYEILGNIAAATEGDVSISYAKERPVENVAIVALTSDRGLCGGFNANVAKQVKQILAEKYASQRAAGKVTVYFLGKKGYDYLKKEEGLQFNRDFEHLFQDLNFEGTAVLTEKLMDAFSEGQYDVIEVAYGQFKNQITQIPTTEQFLPIQKLQEEGAVEKKTVAADFIFEPDRDTLIEELVPKILKTRFYRFLLDSNASEQGARMTAMDNATNNAEDLLRELKIQYNRARQAAITTELTEIVSGAAALNG